MRTYEKACRGKNDFHGISFVRATYSGGQYYEKRMIPVTITEKALEEIKRTIADKNIPSDYGLRVGARGGGCAGTSFIIGFDKVRESDMVYNIADLPVYVEKKDILFLLGTEVDFYEGNEARGFTFVKADEKQPVP